jgi:hypothetical protein
MKIENLIYYEIFLSLMMVKTKTSSTIVVGVGALLVLVIASTPLAFQIHHQVYAQDQSQKQSKGVFVAKFQPRGASAASGQAILKLAEDGNTMSYTINATNIQDVNNIILSRSSGGRFTDLAVLHRASSQGPLSGPINGTLTSGNFTTADLVGPLQGKKMIDLLKMISDGEVYINVQTQAFPLGELNGKVEVG